jgi:hypothetical protein
MASSHFIALKDEIENLRAALAARIDALGNYSEEEKRRTVAYMALAHGCVEVYLKSRCKEIVKHASEEWDRGKLNCTLLSLLSFSGIDVSKPPSPPEDSSKRQAWKEKLSLSGRLKNAIKAYEKTLKEQNGIKETNVVALLLPVGLEYSELDSVMVAELNSFGKDRGYAVHVVDREFRDATDPKTEIDRVTKILAFLEKLDAQLDSLMT